MNPEKDRERLFKILNEFIGVSHKKFMLNHGKAAKTSYRLGWGRFGKDCILAYGKLLETHELEQLAKDVEEIKKKVNM